MTKKELEGLGFRIENLPSGRINLYNKTQFKINDLVAYFCSKGEYQKTMEQTNIDSLLVYIKKIEFI
jgi:hypothetical protein